MKLKIKLFYFKCHMMFCLPVAAARAAASASPNIEAPPVSMPADGPLAGVDLPPVAPPGATDEPPVGAPAYKEINDSVPRY